MASKTIILLPLLLAACGTAEPGANQAAASSSSQQANGAAANSASAAAPAGEAELATAALTPEGWGPLKIGMTVKDIIAALGPDADPEAVGGADPASCDQFRPARAPKGMLVMVEEGRLSRISLIENSPVETDKGIKVGDGRDKVAKAYGAAAVPSLHKYVGPPAGYLDAWVGEGAGDAFQAKPSDRGIRYEIDAGDRVSAIHAGGPSIQYVEGCS